MNSAAVQVAYRSQDLVYPSELPGDTALRARLPDGCVDGRVLRQRRDGSSPFAAGTANNFQPTRPRTSSATRSDAANALLLDGACAPVVLDVDAEALENSPQFRNGVRSGKLFANLADAECDLGLRHLLRVARQQSRRLLPVGNRARTSTTSSRR